MSPLTRLAAIILVALPPAAVSEMASIEGRWLSGDGDGWVEITLVGDKLIGKIVGSPNDGPNDAPRYDDLNPDPALRARPLKGLTVMSGFRYNIDGRWVDGRIYDPNSGNTYKGIIQHVDANTLKLRGYVGISLFGRTEIWVRDDE
jgi:uncharacterized protein (DUF2147 family)